MEVGDRDLLNPNVMRDNMHDWVVANENMAKVLAAKGYHYQFVFARNAGHTDGASSSRLCLKLWNISGRGIRSRDPGIEWKPRYFKSSATLATPAFAQASSVSWPDPELPTPPMVSLPDLDGHAAAQRQDAGDVALRRVRRIAGAFLKLERGGAEHARRIGLAPGHFHLLGAGLLIAQDHHHLARPVDHGYRRVIALGLARRERRFGDGLGHGQDRLRSVTSPCAAAGRNAITDKPIPTHALSM